MNTVLSPGPAAWKQMLYTEGKLVWRDTAGVFLPLGLPLLILVMNSFGTATAPDPELGDVSPLSAYITPMTLVLILAMIGIVNLPSHLATYRQNKVLRRLSATPAHPVMVLISQMVVNGALATAGMAAALGLAFTVLGVSTPARPWAALGAVALIGASVYGIGLVVAAVSPSANAAIAIGLVVFFAMMAAGGGFAPRETLPETLATIGEYTPFGAGLEILVAAWVGLPMQSHHLMALAVTTVVSTLVAIRLFRWE